MNPVLAVPFRSNPSAQDVARFRGMCPGMKFIASLPPTADEELFDNHIFHVPRHVTGIEKTLYYGNRVMRPLMERAVTLGDVVILMHDDITIATADLQILLTFIERIPTLQFASGQPRTGLIPGQGSVVLDNPDRFMAWRSSSAMHWLEPFATEDAKGGESTMDIVMRRMSNEGLSEGTDWIWFNDMPVGEERPFAPIPVPDPAP